MRFLPSAARLYVWTVTVAGFTLFAICLPHARFQQPWLFAALLILSSASAALKVHLPLTAGKSTMSISYAVDFASLLLLGPHETMLVTAGSALSQCSVNRKGRNPFYRTAFSIASLVITIQIAGLIFEGLGGTSASLSLSAIARPLVGAATAAFLVNTGLVAAAIALSTRERIAMVWHNNFWWIAPSYFVGAGTSALAVALVQNAGYWIAPISFVPLYLTYRTYNVYLGRMEDKQRHVQQTSDLHLSTLEALARAIDAKDQTTHMHIRRVQLYATRLAKATGLSDSEIQGVKTAALLHDIGKLAVPEYILSKPGPLTQEEFQKIRIHPQVGAEIIAKVPFPYPVAPLILSHHERWDGKGYPQGLGGEQIPIGARILTIVDYYDAVTTERPYHAALSAEAAVALLKHEMGRALDPNLVPMFVELLPALVAEAGPDAVHDVAAAPRGQLPSRTATSRAATATTTTAFENIALAHREIYALYEIAQSMGTCLSVSDTMALISSKISKVVPWTGCALFLHHPETGVLKCRFAVGAESGQLLNSTLSEACGIAELVAGHRQTIIASSNVTIESLGLGISNKLKSAIVCPLTYNDAFIGCLSLYHTEPNRYSEDHRRLLERVAEQAGAVIHNSIVFAQTQEDALTDPLTGLPNRRSMFVHLARELARASRLKSEVAVLVMDLDDFKDINDTYGHNVGDQALREVAAALQAALRPYDMCVRYAGDEFIVVLADCSREAANAKRRELQSLVEEILLEVRPEKQLRLGISAGVSVFPEDGTTFEALLADADHRMYRDKAFRRGQLPVLHSAPADFAAVDSYDETIAGATLALVEPEYAAAEFLS
jgi:diguanylate cyclase (GGDEF)-like protein/putative nucleotidyltransferase with HDIG domain